MTKTSYVKNCLLLAAALSTSVKPANAARPLQRPWLDTEGLYYLDARRHIAEKAFVITRDGKAIPPKANDPEAPTLPGLYVARERFQFASYRVTSRLISFRTISVGGVRYSFVGRVGREKVESIEHVPYVVGTLIMNTPGRTSKQSVRFVHAVVV